MRIALPLPITLAVTVRAATRIAELIAAAASHVIAAFTLNYPVLALFASLCTNFLRPIFQHLVLGKFASIYLTDFGFKGCSLLFSLEIVTGLFYVEDYLARKAVLQAAGEADVIGFILACLVEKVVAAIRRALKHVGILIPDLLPFKLLATIHLLRRQKLV